MTEDEPVAKSSLTRADSVDDMIAQVGWLITKSVYWSSALNEWRDIFKIERVERPNCFVPGEASEPTPTGGEERFWGRQQRKEHAGPPSVRWRQKRKKLLWKRESERARRWTEESESFKERWVQRDKNKQRKLQQSYTHSQQHWSVNLVDQIKMFLPGRTTRRPAEGSPWCPAY